MLRNAKRCAALVIAISALVWMTAASAGDANTITIENFNFMPMQVSVSAGTTVTWKNADEEPHTVTSESGAFRSGAIDGGGSYSFKFTKPGTYKYLCSIHPQMVGTIMVK